MDFYNIFKLQNYLSKSVVFIIYIRSVYRTVVPRFLDGDSSPELGTPLPVSCLDIMCDPCMTFYLIQVHVG